MSSTNKLIIYNYPYELDVTSIQNLFGENTTVLIDYLTRNVILQYNTKQDCGLHYVKHSHKIQSLYYCDDSTVETFLDNEYTLRQSPIYNKNAPTKQSSNKVYPFDSHSSRKVLFSPMNRPASR